MIIDGIPIDLEVSINGLYPQNEWMVSTGKSENQMADLGISLPQKTFSETSPWEIGGSCVSGMCFGNVFFPHLPGEGY